MDAEWVPTQWMHRSDADNPRPRGALTIERMVSPFYAGERFAVRQMGGVLTTTGEWECEPMPSSRDDAFYDRCRFKTFAEATAAARQAMAQEQ